MKKHYVYELYNSLGTIEYVGETTKPKQRLYQHTRRKPKEGYSGFGEFFGRQDISMHIVSEFDNRTDAMRFETLLKIQHNLPSSERDRSIKNGRTFALPVVAYKKDGTFVGEFVSGLDCARKLNLRQSNLVDVLKNRKKSIQGYIINYK